MKEGLRRHSVAQQQRRQEKSSSRINLGFPNSLNSLDRVSRCFQEGSITDGVCCVHYCACFLHVCEETAVLALPNDDVYLLHPLSAYSYDMEFFCRFFFLGASSQLIPPCEIYCFAVERRRETQQQAVYSSKTCASSLTTMSTTAAAVVSQATYSSITIRKRLVYE